VIGARPDLLSLLLGCCFAPYSSKRDTPPLWSLTPFEENYQLAVADWELPPALLLPSRALSTDKLPPPRPLGSLLPVPVHDRSPSFGLDNIFPPPRGAVLRLFLHSKIMAFLSTIVQSRLSFYVSFPPPPLLALPLQTTLGHPFPPFLQNPISRHSGLTIPLSPFGVLDRRAISLSCSDFATATLSLSTPAWKIFFPLFWVESVEHDDSYYLFPEQHRPFFFLNSFSQG